MDYQSILVEIGADDGCRDRLRAAAVLAFRFGAHLTGVTTTGVRVGHVRGMEDSARRAVLVHEQLRAHAFGHANLMRDIMAETGHAISWSHEMVEDDPARALTQLACAADLLLLARRPPWSGMPPLVADPAEAVLLDCGRPVMVVPDNTPPLLGGHVLIAWNDSPEAARAVADALPLLGHASMVTVVSASDAAGAEPSGPIIRYLASHGIEANVRPLVGAEPEPHMRATPACRAAHAAHSRHAAHAGPGEALLRTARALSADMIIAGCYGHSRMRELAFGGVSRTLLQRATVPLVMSH